MNTDLSLPSLLPAHRVPNGNTRRAYTRHLTDFSAWLDNDRQPAAVTPGDVAAWLGTLRGDATRKQAKAALNSLFSYLVESGVIPRNPVREVRLEKSLDVEHRTDVLSRAELVRLDRALVASPYQVQDQALLATGLYTLARRKALVGMTIGSVQLGGAPQLHFRDKGGKHRRPPLFPAVATALGVWLESRTGEPAESPLWLNRRGKALNEASLYRRTLKWGEEASLDKRLTPHMLRATGISHLLDFCPLGFVQRLAGHSLPETTLRYLKETECRLIASQDVRLY